MTANMLGLVPGFALQDGDLMAKLFTDMGGWGLGSLVDRELRAQGLTFQTAQKIRASVNLVTYANATNDALRLLMIPECTSIRIYNTTTQALKIYPPATDQRIASAAEGVHVTLPASGRGDFMFIGEKRWMSATLGASIG
jgi:hypothetical protein